MANWDCPSCSEPHRGAKHLMKHLFDTHLSEETVVTPEWKEYSQSVEREEDSNIDRYNNSNKFSCSFPACTHKKQYRTKGHLQRHYFNHFRCTKPEDPRCPYCHHRKETLGALKRHWDKSCKRKFEKNGPSEAQEEFWLEKMKQAKQEALMHLKRSLNERSSEKLENTRVLQSDIQRNHESPIGMLESTRERCDTRGAGESLVLSEISRQIWKDGVTNESVAPVADLTLANCQGCASHDSSDIEDTNNFYLAEDLTAPHAPSKVSQVSAAPDMFDGDQGILANLAYSSRILHHDNVWWSNNSSDYDFTVSDDPLAANDTWLPYYGTETHYNHSTCQQGR